MEQPSLIVHFALESDADPDAVQRAIEQRFRERDDLEIQARREQMRFTGPEAVELLKNAGIVIAASVIVLRQSRGLAGEVLKFVEEVVRGVRGVKSAAIDTGKKRVPVDKAAEPGVQNAITRRTAKRSPARN
jgi:hypothetical protein